MTEAIKLIAEERRSQIEKHRYTAEHDDRYPCGDLAVQAAALAVQGTDAWVVDEQARVGEYPGGQQCDTWGLLKRYKGNRLRALTVAGALIAAELDRELRAGRCDSRVFSHHLHDPEKR